MNMHYKIISWQLIFYRCMMQFLRSITVRYFQRCDGSKNVIDFSAPFLQQ